MFNLDVVREDSVLGGRWCLAGTTIPVADVRLDYLCWNRDEVPEYSYRNLTTTQIQAALDFDFPALYETTISMIYLNLTFGCVCGEETSKTLTGFAKDHFACACGRMWRYALVITQVSPEAMSSELELDGVGIADPER